MIIYIYIWLHYWKQVAILFDSKTQSQAVNINISEICGIKFQSSKTYNAFSSVSYLPLLFLHLQKHKKTQRLNMSNFTSRNYQYKITSLTRHSNCHHQRYIMSFIPSR